MSARITILRSLLDEAAASTGLSRSALTVLAPQRDPYRLDTPAHHARGQWLADAFNQVVGPYERIHLRGLHYRLVGRVNKPDGKPYINDADTWEWLSEHVIKAARFLGYVPWSRLIDQRNAPPRVYRESYTPPAWQMDAGEVSVWLPDTLTPKLYISGDLYRQPWQQIIVAEKSGIGDLIDPVARRYHATLAMPNGEWSDAQLYEALADAIENDGRPVVIHQLGDFDPAGWQMAVSTARTAQALKDSQFPDLEIKVQAPALTREQCIEWDLPSTPLKATEKRADKWLAAMEREQTELDAAIALVPREFAKAVADSLSQYHDHSIARQAVELRSELEAEANRDLERNLGADVLAKLRTEAQSKLDQLDELVNAINESLSFSPGELGYLATKQPETLIGETNEQVLPLFDSSQDFATASRRLIARKQYSQEAGR